jgi:hypothetical protein
MDRIHRCLGLQLGHNGDGESAAPVRGEHGLRGLVPIHLEDVLEVWITNSIGV